ncbi:MAG: cupin [Microbacteriaceae bacterium]|nr:cupin [Microbacteriaceae bacterium]
MISVDATEFSLDYWGARPLLSPSLGDFSDLFSLAAADELISERGIRTPFVRMANEGALLDASRYTSSGGFGAEVGDQLDSGKVLAEFAAGSTVVLQGLHRTWAPLAEFTRLLSRELSAPCQVNAYITPDSSRGFDPHYDVHDVFVLQIHGCKHWTIHEPVHEHPLRDQPWSDHRDAVAARATRAPVIDQTFAPGDVLYLPRGWIHSAVATGGTSIHLTIGAAAFTRWDIVQQLVAGLADDAELRRPMPLGIDFDDTVAMAPIVAGTRAALSDALVRAAAEPVGSALARKLSAATRPQPVSPLATVEALATLDASTRVRWRPGLDERIDSHEGGVSIVFGSKRVTLPVEAAVAIASLREGVHVAGRLAGLDESSSLVVTKRLLREGVLVLDE